MSALTPQEQPNASLIKQPGLKIESQTVRGDWKTLKAAAAAARVGFALDSTADLFGGLRGKVASVSCVRSHGDYADYTVSVTERETVAVWGLDYQEIQKPIRTWHADKEGEEKPDLEKLKSWEGLGAAGDRDAYKRYVWKTDGGTSSAPEEILEGVTLTLAKMIREDGVESYAIYTPVLTRTTTLNDLPEDIGKNIGKIGTPKASGDEAMGEADLSVMTALAGQWLKNADRLQGAVDGTFQRVEIWIGADKWNPNLYHSAE